MTRATRAALAAVLLTLAGQASAQSEPAKADQPAAAPAAKAPDAATQAPAKEQFVYVTLKTSQGDIILELDQAKAPKSVENYLRYVDAKHYDGTIFHRVINGFMVQGGGMTPDMKEKPTGKGVVNEWQNGLKNVRGSVAMARLGGKPDSATAQFFINVADNGFLDNPRDGAGYAVFGKVVAGMDVVDKIKSVPTGNKGGHSDVPVEPVLINAAVRTTADELAKIKK